MAQLAEILGSDGSEYEADSLLGVFCHFMGHSVHRKLSIL
jgi:hypothetical protein